MKTELEYSNSVLEAVVILKSEICNERDESVYRQIKKKIELTLYNSKYIYVVKLYSVQEYTVCKKNILNIIKKGKNNNWGTSVHVCVLTEVEIKTKKCIFLKWN